MRIFVRTEGLSPLLAWYFYIDRPPWLADGFFARQGLRVHFRGDFAKEGFDWSVIMARVRPWDAQKFEKSMAELRWSTLLHERDGYDEACASLASLAGQYL